MCKPHDRGQELYHSQKCCGKIYCHAKGFLPQCDDRKLYFRPQAWLNLDNNCRIVPWYHSLTLSLEHHLDWRHLNDCRFFARMLARNIFCFQKTLQEVCSRGSDYETGSIILYIITDVWKDYVYIFISFKVVVSMSLLTDVEPFFMNVRRLFKTFNFIRAISI